jgi:hypothetical protein
MIIFGTGRVQAWVTHIELANTLLDSSAFSEESYLKDLTRIAV